MRNYQSVLILKPDLDEAQVEESVNKLTAIFQKFGGSILKLDKWGKKRLSYRVRKNKFGFYLNIYHTCEPDGVPDLEREYQLYDLIIKYMVIRLEDRDIERVMAKEAAAAESAKVAESSESKEIKPEDAKASKSEDAKESKPETPAAAGKSD